MPTNFRRLPATSKHPARNIKIRRSPKFARSLVWFEKYRRSIYARPSKHDGWRGKIETYRVGKEDADIMSQCPLEIWTERQLMLLMRCGTDEGFIREMALVPVELMQQMLGYGVKEFADPV